MPLRPCLDCGTLTDDTRCGICRSARERERDQQRGTRQQRGYDADYDAAGRDPAYVSATHCVTCDERFTASNPKTKGHSVALRRGGRGSRIIAQCRRCNYGWRRTGA